MNKTEKIGRISAMGSLDIFWGIIASAVVSTIGIIIVARLLGPSQYGLVAIAWVAPNFIAVFRDWGINSAMTRYIAEYMSCNKVEEARSVFVSGLIIELMLGAGLSSFAFLISGFFSTSLFHTPGLADTIRVASFVILGGALQTVVQSACRGFERMRLLSVTMVVQATAQSVLATLLVLMGLGTLGAVLGSTVGLILGAFVGLVILYLGFLRRPHRLQKSSKHSPVLRTMFRYGLPLSLATMVGGFLTQFYSMLMAVYCIDTAIGNYQVATNLAVLLTFFASPITIVLFPAFSKLRSTDESGALTAVFQASVKYGSLVVVPAAAATMALASPLVNTIFGHEYGQAPLFLSLLAISYLLSVLGSLSIGNLVSGQGRTDINLYLALIAAVIGIPLSLYLIPRFGILGLIVATLLAGIPSTAIVTGVPTVIAGLWYVKKIFNARIDWNSSARILLSSLFAAVVTYIVELLLHLSDWLCLAIGAASFVSVYTIGIAVSGALTREDVRILSSMFEKMGLVRRVLQSFSIFMRWLSDDDLENKRNQDGE